MWRVLTDLIYLPVTICRCVFWHNVTSGSVVKISISFILLSLCSKWCRPLKKTFIYLFIYFSDNLAYQKLWCAASSCHIRLCCLLAASFDLRLTPDQSSVGSLNLVIRWAYKHEVFRWKRQVFLRTEDVCCQFGVCLRFSGESCLSKLGS